MSIITCIVGTTASGKTSLALRLAALLPSIIISADSRQVYQGMDIVTGKDHPKNVVIQGIDLVRPDQPISVAIWYDAIRPHLKQAYLEDKQIIVVGGTGLYVRAITDGIETMSVPINQSLRNELAVLPVADLQLMLKMLSPSKLANMNHSDAHNSRRLIRAIEVCKDPSFAKRRPDPEASRYTMIGLKYSDLSLLESKINDRVKRRLDSGAVQETESLLAQYDSNRQSMSAIGYRSIIRYLKGEHDYDQMIESWVRDEVAYAKRQLTWFNKQNVVWYDRGRMSLEEIYGNLSG